METRAFLKLVNATANLASGVSNAIAANQASGDCLKFLRDMKDVCLAVARSMVP